MKRMTVVVALAFPICTASTAFAQVNFDSYVASTGSDSNNCVRLAPCGTYTRAFAQTAAGGIIHAVDASAFGALTSTVGRTVGLGTARQIQFAFRVNF